MNSQRGQVSTFAIAMLMSVLVIGVGLSVATCSATDPEDLPWNNETDVIIQPSPLPIPPIDPLPIPPTDPFEALNLRIEFLNTNLQDLTREFFLLQTAYNEDVAELESKIDTMETTLETYSNEVVEQIESLENRISSLQTITLFAYIAIAVTVIGGFYFIKRLR